MAAIGYLLDLVSLAIQVYIYIIVARALISWVSPDPYNPVVRFLYRATEPVLRPVREMLPISRMGIDFSPMIVILGLILLMRVIPWIYGGV